MVIYANENDAIIRQKVLCQLQSRKYHVEPVGMETPVAFGILNKAIALGVKLPAVRQILVGTLRKIVLIDKIAARIVRRVYVNHLDFAEISLLQ